MLFLDDQIQAKQTVDREFYGWGETSNSWSWNSYLGSNKLQRCSDSWNIWSWLEFSTLPKDFKKEKKEMEKLFSEGFIIQQDGSPMHRAEMCLKYINKKNSSNINSSWMALIFTWPEPIENVWRWLRNQVNKDLLQTSKNI